MIFLHFDADNIGNLIELLLLDGKLEEAQRMSCKIKSAMNELRNTLERDFGAKVHIFAGDDLIVSLSGRMPTGERIQDMRNVFKKMSGVTISCGSGFSVEDALANLRRAKLSGKNRYIGLT